MVEVVRALAEDAGRLTDIGRVSLPRSVFAGGVLAVVRRRLERVPQEARAWLKLAAVVGRQVDLKVMEYALTPQSQERAIENWLTVCAGAAVLEISDGQWRFAHEKIREIIVRDLSENERSTLHRQIAESLETVYPNERAYAAALLEHWRAAGERDKERHYTIIAAEQMLLTSSFRQAVELLEQAQERLGEDAVLLKLLGDAHEALSEYPQAAAVYTRSLELASETDLITAAALVGLGRVLWRQGDYASAETYCQRALALSQQVSDHRTAALALRTLGVLTANWRGNHVEGAKYYHQSMNLYHEVGDQQGIAQCLNNLATSAKHSGDTNGELDYYQQSLSIFRAVGDRDGEALVMDNLGSALLFKGDFSTAYDYFQHSLVIRRQIGNRYGLAAAFSSLGNVALIQGDYRAAWDFYQQCLTLQQQIGYPYGIADTLGTLGLAAYAQKDYSAAYDYMRQSLERFQEIEHDRGTTFALIFLAHVHFKRNEPEIGRQLLVQALQTKSGTAIDSLLAGLGGFAFWYLAIGQAERSAELVGLVKANPSVYIFVKRFQLEPLLHDLAAVLPPEQLEAALTRGTALELDAVVKELLEMS
jgi:tetratricopeptide (TPR) repeat protein